MYCSTGTGHVFLCRWPPLLGTGIWSKYAASCFKLDPTVDVCVCDLGAVQLNSSLLTISVIAILLPGAFHMALQGQPEYDELSTDYNILKISHAVRELLLVICLILRSSYRLQLFSFSVGQQDDFLAINPTQLNYPVYASYLVFQLLSHKALYDDDSEDVQPTKRYTGENPFRLHRTRRNIEDGETVSSPSSAHGEASTMSSRPADANPDVEPGTHSTAPVETEAPEQPLMSLAVCLLLLVVVTAVCTCRDSHTKFSEFSL
jgi:Ca2+:H+ antiporter